MANQTSNLLQHYLTSVHEVTVPKPKNKQTRKKNALKDDKPNHPLNNKKERYEVSSTLAYASSLIKEIERDYDALTKVQQAIIDELIRLSFGQSVPINTIINELATKLQLCAFAIKQELAHLLNKQVIIGHMHKWQGQHLRVAPLWRQYHLQLKSYEEAQPHLAACQLVDSLVIRPLEKQLLFIMFQLKHTSLQFNQMNRLNKSNVAELRAKILTINPLLSILDESMFQVETELDLLHADDFLYKTGDAVVDFILHMVCMLNFVERKEHRFIWLEQNWLSWLALEEQTRHKVLKLLVMEMIAQKTKKADSYLFMNVLAMPNHWVKLDQSELSQKSASNIIKLAYAFGWIEAVYKQDAYYIKRVPQIICKSEPQLLSNFQLLCFPDCAERSLWEVLHIAKIEQNQQLLIFQIDAQSIMQASYYGYTPSKIKTVLKLDINQLPQWKRLCQLAAKLNEDTQMAKPKRMTDDIVHELDEKGRVQANDKWMSYDLCYAVGIQSYSEPNFIETELKDTKATLKKYPEQWFTTLRNYHVTTVKEIVELAQAHGLELEVKFGQTVTNIIATISYEKDNEIVISVTYKQNLRAKEEKKRFHIEQFSSNMVRIIRDY